MSLTTEEYEDLDILHDKLLCALNDYVDSQTSRGGTENGIGSYVYGAVAAIVKSVDLLAEVLDEQAEPSEYNSSTLQ